MSTPGIGMRAGWALTFHRESPEGRVVESAVLAVGSDSYDAEVEATLPGGLEGGVYTVTIDGLIDAHYQTIAQDIEGKPPTVMRLYLFWQNAAAADVADRLVAELTVVSVARRVGPRHYETVITARERVFERLGRRIVDSIHIGNPHDAVQWAADDAGVRVEFHNGFEGDGHLPDRDNSEHGRAGTTLDRGNTFRQEIAEVASAIERAKEKYGRGVLIIRDGTLHVGVRPRSLRDGAPAALTPRTGLVEVTAAGTVGVPPTDRRRYTLTLRGRPDLKPGDVVRFDRPVTERAATTLGLPAALAGSLLGAGFAAAELTDPTLLYVESVTHRLGRTSAFVTTVAGVDVTAADQLYDPPPTDGRGSGPGAGGASAPSVRLAGAVRARIHDALAGLRLVEAGEVRAATSSGTASAANPPRQTATVWRGAADPDGHPNRLARLPVRRAHPDVRERVPRVTPFAWGNTGLVVPRYPGTRVLLSHGHGAADDPVDLGALWDSGAGPESEPGDWWLILPVGVAQADRASVDDDARPEPHTGSVTQDLIDADGNRVIEVGELTVRVTRKLASAGTRPARATDADSVTIEHADGGSKLVMTADGTVHIRAKKIELDAGPDGDITLAAKKVTVSVKDSMDVSKS